MAYFESMSDLRTMVDLICPFHLTLVFKSLVKSLTKLEKNSILGNDEQVPCFLAGDVRSTEVLPLASMHTMFVRLHNRIALEVGCPSNFSDFRID